MDGLESTACRLTGIVEEGKHLGRTLGFPTVNIRPDAASPAHNGVWAARIRVDEGGEWRWCMLNQGRHPTAPEGQPTIEAHILDFSGDLYGHRVTVEYERYLRPEKRFDSLEALTRQLAMDCEDVRRIAAAEA